MSSVMTCPGCGAEVPASEGRYSESGDLVCRACLAKSQIAHQANVVKELKGGKEHGEIIYGSSGALLPSLVSLVATHRFTHVLAL